jgi:hypothetical protein
MTKKRQSDFRKIMGNKYDCESLDVLDDPMQYFDDNEDIDSVQMEVLKDLKKQMNPKYKRAAAEGNTDNRRLGQLPEERAALEEGENKTERERRKSINYLTNRKKAYGNWDRLTDTFCCCCSKE